MKKINFLLISLLIFAFTYIPTYASTNPAPTANIYKEGIYHFPQTTGKHLILKLNTPDKPMTLIIIEDNGNKLKYYFNFEKDSERVDIYLDSPLKDHTTTIIGDGELIFSFN